MYKCTKHFRMHCAAFSILRQYLLISLTENIPFQTLSQINEVDIVYTLINVNSQLPCDENKGILSSTWITLNTKWDSSDKFHRSNKVLVKFQSICSEDQPNILLCHSLCYSFNMYCIIKSIQRCYLNMWYYMWYYNEYYHKQCTCIVY